ncbi:hypothetical protein HPB52_024459 [Rhipicephalus sanguineus]|uniref:Uncharacterized protein n=1 Tax=Rhipicephalus sanguineus TaxID=34632 RepID=A0A9D4TCE7_RHISA|nr:hypothetical protein HPB52_024459 [Rhipicephalus sanguineus]
MTLLEEFVRREGKLSLYVDPLLTFARDELCLHAEDCLLKIRKQVITYQDCLKRDPGTAKPLALLLRKLIVIVGEMASSLEKIGEVPITDWVGVDVVQKVIEDPPSDVEVAKRVALGRKALRNIFAEMGRLGQRKQTPV